MRKFPKTLLIASIVATGVVALSSLYAHEQVGSPNAMTGDNMMGGGGMMGMMGGGMMGMMGQTSQMMDHCASMMQGTGDHGNRPNEQWRKPAVPDKGS